MAATIIYLAISLFVSLIFIVLGIKQYRAEKPVAINTGEKPPSEDELTSVAEWNHRHGRNLIIFGCVLFITLSVFIFLLKNWITLCFKLLFLCLYCLLRLHGLRLNIM